MEKRKALALLNSIFDTHAEAHSLTNPEVTAALNDAKIDIIGIVEEIFNDQSDLITQMKDAMNTAIRNSENANDENTKGGR